MRHVVKKMHGLNTNQLIEYTPEILQNQDSTQSQNAVIMEQAVDNPGGLGYILAAFSPTAEREFYIKRLYKTVTLVNGSLFPCMVQAIWLRSRLDLFQTCDALMAVDAPSTLLSYTSNLTGPDFRKSWKVIKSKHFVMKPGYPYRFTVKSRYAGRQSPIIGSVEGNTTYTYRKNNSIMYFKFDGIPQVSNSTGTYTTCKSSVIITGCARWFASYYNMDDATATSAGVTYIPPNMPADNTLISPTLYNGAIQSTPALSNYYVPPNSVMSFTA